MHLYCATGNAGKLAEFRLAARLFPLEIDAVPAFKDIPPCVEDGATFEENAFKKATYYARHAEGMLFADDSGLVVDALGGEPGIYSARYSGPGATDASNNRLLLDRMRGVTNRAASFVCAIAVVKDGKQVGIYTGRVEGVLLDEPRGSAGFGYDPLFYYPPFGCTFGEAGEEQKFGVSHRGNAFRAMLAALT